MSFIRPAQRSLGLGLGLRHISTSRVAAVQASRIAKAPNTQTISPEETAGFTYVPGGPILKGTVNDATTFPAPNAAHGSYHWAFERILAASLVPLTVAAAVASPTAHPIVDGVLGVSLLVHSHIGFTACIDDYVHERKNPVLGPVCRWLLRIGTAGAVYGIYEFNTNDIGLTEFIEKAWKA